MVNHGAPPESYREARAVLTEIVDTPEENPDPGEVWNLLVRVLVELFVSLGEATLADGVDCLRRAAEPGESYRVLGRLNNVGNSLRRHAAFLYRPGLLNEAEATFDCALAAGPTRSERATLLTGKALVTHEQDELNRDDDQLLRRAVREIRESVNLTLPNDPNTDSRQENLAGMLSTYSRWTRTRKTSTNASRS